MKALVALISTDQVFLARTKELLEAVGYTVAAYDNPDVLLEAMVSVHFDVLVCTVVIGSSNGFDVAARAVRLMPRLRVLFASEVHHYISSDVMTPAIAYEFTSEAFEERIRSSGLRTASDTETFNEIQAYLAQRLASDRSGRVG